MVNDEGWDVGFKNKLVKNFDRNIITKYLDKKLYHKTMTQNYDTKP